MNDQPRTAPRAGAGDAASPAMVYARDRDSEGILRQSLSDLGASAAVYITGGIEAAIADLAHRSSPRLLVVDVSGTDDPVARVMELAQVCEPSTGVVVIGETNDVALYRSLKDAGIAEYFYKPLVGNLVSRTCSAILVGAEQRMPRTGKLIFVMGVRGGCGATTIATWAAWHLAEMKRRRVLLFDLDLSAGDAALQLDMTPNHTLREALEQPERVDDLFLERGVIHVTPRLDLLASLEPLDQIVNCREEAVLALLNNLLHRYRYVFVDLPHTLAPALMRVLHLPSMCILVSDSSLVAARDVARWREKIGANTADRVTLHVLNKAGMSGNLPTEDFVRALAHAPDVVIPYEREIGVASMLGAKGMTADGVVAHALAPVLRHIAGETVEENRSLLHRLFG
jgi:pilus assembly protein CpaE